MPSVRNGSSGTITAGTISAIVSSTVGTEDYQTITIPYSSTAPANGNYIYTVTGTIGTIVTNPNTSGRIETSTDTDNYAMDSGSVRSNVGFSATGTVAGGGTVSLDVDVSAVCPTGVPLTHSGGTFSVISNSASITYLPI